MHIYLRVKWLLTNQMIIEHDSFSKLLDKLGELNIVERRKILPTTRGFLLLRIDDRVATNPTFLLITINS